MTSEITALTEELLDLARHAPGKLAERIGSLTIREQAELALRLPAPQRLELLLHAPKPMRLVRSLPDFEFYMTIRELGPSDALPLVALGSADQIGHLLDLESWRQDDFDPCRSGAWVALLLEAGEPTLKRFLRNADEEFLALLFQQWARAEQIEPEDGADVHGVGQTEAGDERGQMSPDGYSRFSPVIPEHTSAVRRIAQWFYADQPERYLQIMHAATWRLRSDLEESARHWRQSRLEEHGFPPWDEAMSVYAPPVGVRSLPQPLEPPDPDGLAAPRTPAHFLAQENAMLAVADTLAQASRERVLHELLSVANRLLVADRADTGDPESHRDALRKGAGYMAIALQARGTADETQVRRVLEEVPLIELFREGHGRAVEVQQRARALVQQGWAAGHAEALQLLDAPVRQRVAALLEPRPLFFEVIPEHVGGGVPRPFRSLAEVQEAGVAVEMAELLGLLLVERLQANIELLLETAGAEKSDPTSFGTFLLTLLAWHATRDELRIDPLPGDVVADFLRGFASRRTAGPEAAGRALEALVRDVTASAALQPRQTALLRAFGRACLERLSAECGSLDPGVPVDRRHVTCLVV